ncbi:MAG: DUF4080 domain-containing protein [Lachnospiraceae bacterium]|nr:DUF4080 domain-containing protein [Lachnospiraceae bacterium]
MKILLVAINAKYIHSNLAVYSLKAYAEKYLGEKYLEDNEIEIAEYTINRYETDIIQDIYERRPDVLTFSCYIWNIEYVKNIVDDLRKIMSNVPIWLGGPEVSYNAPAVLKEMNYVKGIFRGEGEETFTKAVSAWIDAKNNNEDVDTYLGEIDGISYRKGKNDISSAEGDCGDLICENRDAGIVDMSKIPFVYENLEDFQNRIIYYESSRGCPFSCSYCLSSIDKKLRFRDIELVKKELQFFLDNKTAQVKFVDRTFNCKRNHSDEIWRYIKENDNGITNFHFEIAADIMTDEEIEIISQMRPGLIQLEIGVQTTNPETIQLIDRKMDFNKVKEVVEKLKKPRNIHLHLDLIAGLPNEDINSFINSFNMVYSLGPDELQLGFLKVLHGSKIEYQIEENEMAYSSRPPYEVLSTKWISYDDILRLKRVEEVLEIFHNSGQFGCAIKQLEKYFENPFDMYDKLGEYYKEASPNGEHHSRIKRYYLLLDFYREYVYNINHDDKAFDIFRQLLVMDVYLRENIKSRPGFAYDMSKYKKQINTFYINEEAERKYLPDYEGYDSKQLAGQTHIERFDFDVERYVSEGEYINNQTFILFDYKNRDPLHYSARTMKVSTIVTSGE